MLRLQPPLPERYTDASPEALAKIAVDPNVGIDTAKAQEIVDAAGFDAETGAKVRRAKAPAAIAEIACLLDVSVRCPEPGRSAVAVRCAPPRIGQWALIRSPPKTRLLVDPLPSRP